MAYAMHRERPMRFVFAFVLVAGATACSNNPSPGGGTAGTTGTGGSAGSSSTAGSTGTGGAAGTTGTGGAAGSTSSDGGDVATDGEPFCSQPLGDCAHLSVDLAKHDVSYCTLSDGVAAECPGTASLLPSVAHGARYTYLDILHADGGTRFVYDTTETLVAVLSFSLNFWPTRLFCLAGPSDFDPTDAMATPVGTSLTAIQAFRDMCAARPDAGPDGP